MTAPRHFLDLAPVGAPALRAILEDAAQRKAARAGLPRGQADTDAPLAGHTLALIFEKPSTRTRVSFDMAMRQLGGSTMVLGAGDLQLGRGETISDTAQVLSRLVDAVMIRTSAHEKLLDLATNASVPVINGLTDRSHPCQVMADILTVEERRGPVAGSTWAWLGDGNNMCNTIIEAAGLFGFAVNVGCPAGYEPDAGAVSAARAAGATITITCDPRSAAAGADVVVTDTWISMGQADSDAKLKAMLPFQVNAALMAVAKADALFLHCLPAHRGEEVTADVIDGTQSAVWDEAENRLHVQKAILAWCLS